MANRIRKAQEGVEAQNFEARKHLLEYDYVNNKQSRQLLEGADQKKHVMEMMQGIIEEYIVRGLARRRGRCFPTRGRPIEKSIF